MEREFTAEKDRSREGWTGDNGGLYVQLFVQKQQCRVEEQDCAKVRERQTWRGRNEREKERECVREREGANERERGERVCVLCVCVCEWYV